VACGTGWLTAGILSMPNVKECRLHAFDVSIPGLKRLNEYAVTLNTTNKLELSVQDADRMVFAEESFDIIFGNSVLHHFEDYRGFLNQCYSILKPGGCAIFGEPFAIGYGLAFGAMKAASQILKIENKTVNYNYKDLRFRIANADNKVKLSTLVDKHLFFQGELERTSRTMGYSAVRFAPVDRAAYYREHAIDGLFREYAIEDERLEELSKEIYGCFADLFGGEERYTETLPTFMHFVLVK
jgi:SAM-dependent methyltransferase